MGKNITLIGCEAFITRGNKVLLGKRKNVYGSGTWALPGGHLEFLERADECLSRELKEEMDLDIPESNLKLLALTDDLQEDSGMHYMHVTFSLDIGNMEPKVNEPEFCEEWKWFSLNKLPKNIFPPHKKIFKTIASKEIYKLKVKL